jgi:beta-lactamase class C
MRKFFVIFLIIACSQLISLPIQAAGRILEVAGDFEVYFNKFIKDRDYPGAAFAIVSRDRVLHLVTVGHTTADRVHPINPQTTFRLASVSKTFAAELVGLLVEDGALSWDDPITRYVPTFKINGDASQIRIQHLLGQSTGLIPHAYDNLLEHGKEMDSIWRKMSGLAFICNPGQCYGYQNSVFSLIDPVVKHATDIPYETLVERRIFRPLDMHTASLGYKAFIENPNHAEPHRRHNGRWKTVGVQRNYYRAAPAAGVNASILDMSKWVQAQLGNKPEVLSPELVDFLIIPRVKTGRELYRKQWKTMLSNAHYGLGWRIYQIGGEQLIYHGGWVSGFRADVAFSPEHDIGFVVLMNAESSGISELTTRFWQMALAPQAPVVSP